jgi:hypothetical protein
MANSGTVDGFVDLQDGINKITNSGAMTGIFSGFGSDTLTNSGSIVAFVAMGDGGNKLTNSGEIGAYIALGIGDDIVTNSGGIGGDVHLGSGNNKLTNSGDIVGEATFGSENDTLTNSGTIGDSIDLGDGSNKLTNTGTISWTVDFGSGDDVGSNTKLIKGEVNLGDGNNTFTNSGTISDHFSAGSGNDTVKNTGTMAGIRLGGGDDSFIGGNHPEYVVDELGGDTYKLGGGDDRLITAGTGIDVFDGGAGQDTFDVSAATDAFFVNLDAKVVTVHNQTLQAASAFSATAQGGSIKGFEIVDGSRQTDFIVGGSVAETISGDYGNDILAGGLGADRLTGGLDDDTFVYFQIKDSGLTRTTRDTITDFEGAGPAGGDVIDLSLINANTKFATDQAFTWIGGDTKFTHLAGELRSVTQGLDTIVQGDVNGDGKADFSIAITGIVALDKSDFAL